MSQVRETKYTSAVTAFMNSVGHASNAQIADHIRMNFPSLSATTIHRITSRMVERKELSLAPSMADGSTRFDAQLSLHDHFQCTGCDRVRDIYVPRDFISHLQKELGGCRISGSITIQGNCEQCQKGK